MASIENLQSLTSAEQLHGPVIVRSARDGRVLESIDPCHAAITRASLGRPTAARSPFIATDPAAGSAQVLLARDGEVKTLATCRASPTRRASRRTDESLAVLATAAAKKKIGALEAGVPQVGDIGASPDEQRIAVVPMAGGELSFVTPDDTFIYEYDWMPDGKGFVGTAAKGDGDNNWWLAELDAFDPAKGVPRSDRRGAVGEVSDGHAAHVAGRQERRVRRRHHERFGPLGGEIYEVPLSRRHAREPDAGLSRLVQCAPVARKQLYATGDHRRPRRTGRDRSCQARRRGTLWSDAVTANAAEGSVSLSADGRAGAAVVEDFGHAPKIIAGPIAEDGDDHARQ